MMPGSWSSDPDPEWIRIRPDSELLDPVRIRIQPEPKCLDLVWIRIRPDLKIVDPVHPYVEYTGKGRGSLKSDVVFRLLLIQRWKSTAIKNAKL